MVELKQRENRTLRALTIRTPNYANRNAMRPKLGRTDRSKHDIDGTIIYTPTPNFFGTNTLIYGVTNNSGPQLYRTE